MSKSYWQKRIADAQHKIGDRGIEDTNEQIKKYYAKTMKKVIAEFEATYDKLQATIADGKEPTPADLYNLDKYWQMQGSLRDELQKLGELEIAAMSENFEKTYIDVYNSFALKSDTSFNNIDSATVNEMINSVWCADNKTWSDRVWNNTEKLAQTLNDEMIACVVAGKKTTELKNLLQERFNVSYRQAESLVRTEIAHIQVSAAKKRYEDYGLEEYEILGREEHDIGCVCKKLHGKKYPLAKMRQGVNAPPFHPNCRCDIMPVISDSVMKDIAFNESDIKTTNKDKLFENTYTKKMGYSPTQIAYHQEQRQKALDKQNDLGNANVKKCIECGDYFVSTGSRICNSCKNLVLRSDYGLKLISEGYAEDKIVDWLIEDTDTNLDRMLDNKRNLFDEWYEQNKRRKKNSLDAGESLAACVDCGEIFVRKSAAKIRCDKCQEIYRKTYKAQKERERRLANKLKSIKK